MEQQKWYQIDFYIGLYDLEELADKHSFKESVDKITELIGDCTIFSGIGSYAHPIGIRINMNSLKVTKFINTNPNEFISANVNKIKEFFDQDCIITNVFECYNLQFN